MVRLILARAILVAAPFVIWFLWAGWARRSGRPMGSTPWPWLVAAAGALVGLSLMATAVFHTDDHAGRYIPGEETVDGLPAKRHSERPQAETP